MTNSQALASALLIVHLVSITTAAIVREPRDPQAADTEEAPVGPLAVMLAPRVGAIAQGIQVANDALWRHSAGLRLITDGYVRVLALHQRWRMFASPSRSEQYVRVSFAIAPTGGSPPGRHRVVHWLVYPTWRPDRVRGLRAFRDSYRDKSLERVIAGFTDRNGPHLLNALNQRRKLGPADTSDL